MIKIKRFVFNYFQENSYLLYDETNEAVLIDSGCMNAEEEQQIIAFVDEKQLKLTHLLCTHLHLDHIFGNEFIFNTYGLYPEAEVKDTTILPSASTQAKAFGLQKEIKDIPVKHHLQDHEKIRFGNAELEVLTVPGHSPGSVAFYCEKQKFVMVGDALFAGSVGRTDLWGGSMDELLTAIQEKLLSLPKDTIIYPGHGPFTSVQEELMNNPYI